MKTKLTEAVTDYQTSRQNLEKVMDAVALAVYWYPPMRRRWDEDDCSEFLCYFYSRIPGMIQRFRYTGSPFEALLKVTIQFQMKSFALQMKRNRIAEKVLACRDFWDRTWEPPALCTGESSGPDVPVIAPPAIAGELQSRMTLNERGILKDASLRKRVLLLLLREADRVSEPLLCHILAITGYEEDWVREKMEMVRKLSFQLEGRRNSCRHRRNLALFNMYCLQEERNSAADRTEKEILDTKLERERQKLDSAERALRRIPGSPTHRQLAEILNIPKGTVDSGLFFIGRILAPENSRTGQG